MLNAHNPKPCILATLLFCAHGFGYAQVQSPQAEPAVTAAVDKLDAPAAEADTVPASGFGQLFSGMQSSMYVQTGLDTWHLRTSVAKDHSTNQNGKTNLFLANSSTAWDYQDTAPWLKVQGSLRPFADTLLSFKYRADQSLGSQVDELSLDQSYYAFGARVGVLDYKTTWCRSYDLDGPWVRENDPICAVDTIGRYLRAAPGIQLYSNFVVGDFKWQAAAGSYSPLWLDYDVREFTNTSLSQASLVTQNDKLGASLNAVHLGNGMELRMGYLRTQQSAETREGVIGGPTFRIDQQVEVLYTGFSMNPTRLLNLRLTHTSTTNDVVFWYPPGYTHLDDTVPDIFRTQSDPNNASVLELNYQGSPRDVFSLAYSVNKLSSDSTAFIKDLPSGTISRYQFSSRFNATTVNTSLSWRRDWSPHVFTVLQLSSAVFNGERNGRVGDPYVYVNSTGTAIGLRLGYKL